MDPEKERELDQFVEDWEETKERNKEIFLHFRDRLAQKTGVSLDFIPRPGLTYSLRAVHENQKDRSLFAMMDVIEDQPRWLSICFYGNMVADPEERGDFVPEGLLGEDAVCFDLEKWDDDLIHYTEKRLDEACRKATEG